MFTGFKVKKLLNKYAAAETSQQDTAIIADLKEIGHAAVCATIEAFQQKKIPSGKAQFLLDKICDESSLEEIVPLIGDPYDEVRRVSKELIAKKWGKPATPYLIETLKSTDTYARTNATELLSSMKSDAFVPDLVSLFNTATPETKRSIIKIIGNIGGITGTKLAMSALNDNNWQVRHAAVKCLGTLKAAESVPPLLEKLDEKDPQMKMMAMDALDAIGDKSAAAKMLSLLTDEDLLVRQRATDCLIHIADAKIVPQVIELMRNPDVNIRRCAIEVLKNLKDPNTSEELMKALKDSDWWVRQIATSSLTALHGDNNITRGFISLTRDPDENLRRCAVEFFNNVVDPLAFDALIERLEDEDWWVREKALRALGKLKDERAVSRIADLINDREMGRGVPEALAKIGGDAALEYLIGFLGENSKRLKIETIKALGQMKNKNATDTIKQCLSDPDQDVASQAVETLKELTGRQFTATPDEQQENGLGRVVSQKIAAGTAVTEAILVLDLCNSTDIANRYGDTFSLNLIKNLTDMVSPIARQEKCRFSKGTGDGFLMTFPDAANAVRFAQNTLLTVAKHNEKAEDRERINIRFAIHFGEAKVDDQGDRLGVAVSMTFRIEGVKAEGLIPLEGGMTPEEVPADNRIMISENVVKEIQQMQGPQIKLVGLFEL
ncbi:MAG: HEAT repeat domain-containing protein, partial [Desulfuromonadales bacterium]|nr:HEAT repeat domain-containing protein [Desulfuromonadales bacterium]